MFVCLKHHLHRGFAGDHLEMKTQLLREMTYELLYIFSCTLSPGSSAKKTIKKKLRGNPTLERVGVFR